MSPINWRITGSENRFIFDNISDERVIEQIILTATNHDCTITLAFNRAYTGNMFPIETCSLTKTPIEEILDKIHKYTYDIRQDIVTAWKILDAKRANAEQALLRSLRQDTPKTDDVLSGFDNISLGNNSIFANQMAMTKGTSLSDVIRRMNMLTINAGVAYYTDNSEDLNQLKSYITGLLGQSFTEVTLPRGGNTTGKEITGILLTNEQDYMLQEIINASMEYDIPHQYGTNGNDFRM